MEHVTGDVLHDPRLVDIAGHFLDDDGEFDFLIGLLGRAE
jgi:hypothetical protein